MPDRLPITTPRLIIRGPKAGDAKDILLAHLESRPELEQWLGWARPWPENTQLKDEIARAAKDFAADAPHRRFEAFAREGNRLLVSLGCTLDGPGRYHLSYWTRTGETGKGYAAEALNGLCRYLFEVAGATHIESGYEPGNIASKRVLEKCGFVSGKMTPKAFPAKPKRLERLCLLADATALPPLDIAFG